MHWKSIREASKMKKNRRSCQYDGSISWEKTDRFSFSFHSYFITSSKRSSYSTWNQTIEMVVVRSGTTLFSFCKKPLQLSYARNLINWDRSGLWIQNVWPHFCPVGRSASDQALCCVAEERDICSHLKKKKTSYFSERYKIVFYACLLQIDQYIHANGRLLRPPLPPREAVTVVTHYVPGGFQHVGF